MDRREASHALVAVIFARGSELEFAFYERYFCFEQPREPFVINHQVALARPAAGALGQK